MADLIGLILEQQNCSLQVQKNRKFLSVKGIGSLDLDGFLLEREDTQKIESQSFCKRRLNRQNYTERNDSDKPVESPGAETAERCMVSAEDLANGKANSAWN